MINEAGQNAFRFLWIFPQQNIIETISIKNVTAKNKSGIITIDKIFCHCQTKVIVNFMLGIVLSKTAIELEKFVVVLISDNQIILLDW